jgi:GT2 family glycosyltransferase
VEPSQRHPKLGSSVARVLVAVIVYNGRSFVPRALRSIARLAHTSAHDVDVLILDDASPEPGWSDELASLCRSLGIDCYTTPRNLGIPRNMNLGLLRALDGRYDGCVLLNSDVVVSAQLIDSLVAASASGPNIASVTAWANDVSIFSLANDNAEAHLADQALLDEVANSLAHEFAGATIELPTGCGFCLYIPTAALDAVGVMDPVFGRGYGEEVDWCCRATERGWRHVLALDAFAFHMGSATNREAGILAKGMRTVLNNEAIVDMRHPWYRQSLDEWAARDPLGEARNRAVQRLVTDAARARGVVIDATWLDRGGPHSRGVAQTDAPGPDPKVRVVVLPDGAEPLVEARVDGWRLRIPVGDDGPLSAIAGLLGVTPSQVRLFDDGEVAGRLGVEAAAAGIAVRRTVRYPERV